MPSRLPNCPRGCFRFNQLPVGKYFRRCGPIVQSRIARGEPVSAYKKVGDRMAVEMLLKERGWGPGFRKGGKAARPCPTRDNPCVFELSREFASRMAEQYAYFRMIQRERAQARRRRTA